MAAPIRVALVGCGDIAETGHLPALCAHEGFVLVAVCDIRPERARQLAVAAGADTDAISDHRELLARADIDAVILALHPEHSVDIAIAFLRAGIHVLDEKPLACNIEDAERLATASAAAEAVYQLGFVFRYCAFVREIQALAGRLRTPATYRIHIADEQLDRDNSEHLARIQQILRASSAATHEGSHVIDYLSLWNPAPLVRVSAQTETTETDFAGPNSWSLIGDLADGSRLELQITWLTPEIPPSTLEIAGPDGNLHVDLFSGTGELVSHGVTEPLQLPPLSQDWRAQLDAFAGAVAGGSCAGAGIADGLRALRVTSAAESSAATGRTTPVQDSRSADAGSAGTASGRHLLFHHSEQSGGGYGRFLQEILRSEGLMSFALHDLADAAPPTLAPDDIAVFARCCLTASEVDAITTAVAAGARVLFLQPQQQVTGHFGVTRRRAVVHPAYVRATAGYGSETALQTHVPVPLCDVPADADIEELMTVSSGADATSEGPAALRFRHGAGACVLVLYDLAEAIARIRFGDPDRASLVGTGTWHWPHACELYHGHLDPALADVPQAEIHAQLLAGMLTDLAADQLPRLWYYTRADQPAAAVFQSDGDWSTPEQFAQLADALESRGATGTFYLMTDTKLPDATVRAMQARGHTFGPHVNAMADADELSHAFPRALAEQTAQFDRRYGQHSGTLQSHCAPWVGYLDWVPLHVAHGYRLLFAALSAPAPLWSRFMCGAGRPIRYADRDGTCYDCWQQPLPIYDDETLVTSLGGNNDKPFDNFSRLLADAVDGHHTTVAILSHPISYATYSQPFMDRAFDALCAAGVPIYNADSWLHFCDQRDAVRITPTGVGAWKVVHRGAPVTVMLPAPDDQCVAGLTIDGGPAATAVHQRFGRRFLTVALPDDRDAVHLAITTDQPREDG
jgi:predicted dehydrogenase